MSNSWGVKRLAQGRFDIAVLARFVPTQPGLMVPQAGALTTQLYRPLNDDSADSPCLFVTPNLTKDYVLQVSNLGFEIED